MTKRRVPEGRKVFRTQEADLPRETRRHDRSPSRKRSSPSPSKAVQDTLRGAMQIFVKTLTGPTVTFDVEGPVTPSTI